MLYSWISRTLNRRRLQRWSGVCLIALALGLVVLLRALPYSSVRLTHVDAVEATRHPGSGFTIGLLHWPVRELASMPELQPFREAMRSSCGDLTGLAAAECASDILSERVPVGEPSSEFVRSDFNAVAHFKAHMAGAPGHCLTRSAILATELLSVGIPARVVQFVPVEGKGHTLVEVWDEGSRLWTVVDPSTSGLIVSAKGRGGSAAELLAEPSSVEWRPFGYAFRADLDVAVETRQMRGLLTGNVLYPEPWLYLRVGERAAPWPLRGEYARVGRAFLTLGPLQQFLFWMIPSFTLVGLGLVGFSRRRASAVHEASWDSTLRPDMQPVREFDALPPS